MAKPTRPERVGSAIILRRHHTGSATALSASLRLCEGERVAFVSLCLRGYDVSRETDLGLSG